ncbi:MAG: serine hydrolase [Bacteriovoracales bacterium]|nr:serine hydrolase [Bacteriovoracales bacterium]
MKTSFLAILSLFGTLLCPFLSFSSAGWPTYSWPTRSLAQAGIDENKFSKFLDYTFLKGKFGTLEDCIAASKEEEKDFQTNSLVVIKDGYLVYEQYACGYKKHHKHILWSVSKSIMATLVGMAKFEDRIDITRSVSSYVEVPQTQTWEQMKVDDLMRMSSGLDWREKYEDSPTDSDVINTLYGSGSDDIIKYIFKRPLKHIPGERFDYSTGDTELLTHVLNTALGGQEAILDFAHDNLFGTLGISDFTIEKDSSGQHFYGGSHFYLTPRDLAKIGLLNKHRGLWDEKRLYSTDWYDYFTTEAPSWSKSDTEDPIYGALWWLNRDTEERNRPYPSAPEDSFFAEGHFGQILAVIPSLDLIVVRNGSDTEKEIDMDKFLALLIRSLR